MPVVTEKNNAADSTRRRKRQVNASVADANEDDDLFHFDFGNFESDFDVNPSPELDPDFEPSIDLPLGIRNGGPFSAIIKFPISFIS